MLEGITILILHHTARPLRCLHRTLTGLIGSTSIRPLLVEVVVQGPPEDVDHVYPTGHPYDLVRIDNGTNLGMGVPITAAIGRFVGRRHKWFMRLDDDIELTSGCIDRAIRVLELERDRGTKADRVMVANQFSKPFMLRTEERVGADPVLFIDVGHIAERRRRDDERLWWYLCDYVDTGCTIIDREAIDEGCVPDPRFFVGGFSIDFGWNACKLGFKSILYVGERVNHFARECRTLEHERVRRSQELVRENGRRFTNKWGVEPLTLTEFTKRTL